jgi:tetratricopeptide (TPR) repeat protein
MTQTQPNLLALAKQGNAKAIAALINRQLQLKGITAKAALKDGCLQIMLESAQVPNQQALVAFIRKGITSLEAASIQRVKVYGRQTGEEFPAWNQEFELAVEPLPSVDSKAAQSTAPHEAVQPTQPLSQELENRSKDFFNQGLAKNTGRNLEAIGDFTQAICFNPNYAEAYFMRGSNRLILKLYERAIEDFNRAIQLKTDYAQAYYERGLARGALNNYQGAVEDYSRAIILNINYDSIYNNRGDAYQRLGLYQEALNDFNQAIHLNPNNVLYYKNRGITLQKIGDGQRANNDFNVANKILNKQENRQAALGCLTLIFLAFVIMSSLSQCFGGSSNTPKTEDTEQIFCKEIVKNPSNYYYWDCKKRGY